MTLYIKLKAGNVWHWHPECNRFVKFTEKKSCGFCLGKGHYLMAGDLHKSSGIVPCRHCDKDGKKYAYAVAALELEQLPKGDKGCYTCKDLSSKKGRRKWE